MRPKWMALNLGVYLALATSHAVAAPNPRSGIEWGAFAGYNRMVAPSVDHSREVNATNGGVIAALMLSYRSSHFLQPFVEVGYARIYSSQERLELAGQDPIESDNSLATWSLVFGPALDLGPLRVRGGMGVYRLQVTSTVLGKTIHPAEYDLGWFASVQGFLFRTGQVQWGLDARALLISEASTATLAFGIAARGDLFSW